jgi:hypothetical protein
MRHTFFVMSRKRARHMRKNLETMSAAAREATNLLKHSYATTVKALRTKE